MRTSMALIAATGLSGAAAGQTYEQGGAAIIFEVWDGLHWSNSTTITPGARVEWRTRVQYTGTMTNLNGMAELWWQPTLENVDNSGAGPEADQLEVGQGMPTSNSIGNIVPEADGDSPGGLGLYGRVMPFGLAGTNAASSNILTVHRHSGTSGFAPLGEWMRLAGNGCTRWAPDMNMTNIVYDGTTTQLLLRGVQSNQTAEASSTAIHSERLDPVIFRGAFIASSDPAQRAVTLGTDERFLRRVGGSGSGDNRRYISWQTSAGDTGMGATGHRTYANAFYFAAIHIVPTNGAWVVVGMGWVAARRRRVERRFWPATG